MTDATTGDQVDNKVSELEQALADILGIPIDTPILKPMPLSLVGSVLEPAIANTAVQTDMYSEIIPGGTLGTDRMLEGFSDLFVNTILNGSLLTISLIYGGVSLMGLQLANFSGITQVTFGVRADFRLIGRGATNQQKTSGHFSIGAEVPTLSWGGVASLWDISRSNPLITVDSTIDQTFRVAATWSVASPTNNVSGQGFEIHRLR
jgi:hypothetical protein